jgi:predicted nucleic acid-binding protein
MNYVVDTSVIIAVIANEPEKALLIENTKGATLLAPPSVHWEIGNAFSAMIKRKRISYQQAAEALVIYRQIPVRFADVELEETLEIVSNREIYAYDAYLLRCAIKYDAALITLDKRLAQIAKEMDIDVVEVV